MARPDVAQCVQALISFFDIGPERLLTGVHLNKYQDPRNPLWSTWSFPVQRLCMVSTDHHTHLSRDSQARPPTDAMGHCLVDSLQHLLLAAPLVLALRRHLGLPCKQTSAVTLHL